MLHSITQHGIDAGLPARPCCLECVQYVSVNAHIQCWALHRNSRTTTAPLDRRTSPVSKHDSGIVGVLGVTLWRERYRRILRTLALHTAPVGACCFSWFLGSLHTKPFPVSMPGVKRLHALHRVGAAHTPAPAPRPATSTMATSNNRASPALGDPIVSLSVALNTSGADSRNPNPQISSPRTVFTQPEAFATSVVGA